MRDQKEGKISTKPHYTDKFRDIIIMRSGAKKWRDIQTLIALNFESSFLYLIYLSISDRS